MNVTIKPVESTLYLKYPGQHRPQPVHVLLDCRDGELTADSDGEIGGAMPMPVYNGLVQRWVVPCLKEEPANALLAELGPLAAQVLAGSEFYFDDQNNRRARFTTEAVTACEAIAALCETAGTDPDDLVQVWDAADYYSGIGGPDAQAQQLGITAETTDEELASIVRREDEEADGVDIFDGLARHLEELRTKARAAAAEAAILRCGCGEITGVPCEWDTSSEDATEVEWMPPHLRQNHEQAGNHGVYPSNGARRSRLAPSCARAQLAADPAWTAIVG